MEFKKSDLQLLWYALSEYSSLFAQQYHEYHDEHDSTDAAIFKDCNRLKDRINARLIKKHGVNMK